MDGGTAPPGRTGRVENLQVGGGRDLDESHEDGTRTADSTPPPTARVVGRHYVDQFAAVPARRAARHRGGSANRRCTPSVATSITPLRTSMGTCGPSTRARRRASCTPERHFCDAGLLAAHGHILLALDTRHVHSTRGLSHACLRTRWPPASVIGASGPTIKHHGSPQRSALSARCPPARQPSGLMTDSRRRRLRPWPRRPQRRSPASVVHLRARSTRCAGRARRLSA